MGPIFGSAPKVTNTPYSTTSPTQQSLLSLLSGLLTSGQQPAGVQAYTGELAPGMSSLQGSSIQSLENIANAIPTSPLPAQSAEVGAAGGALLGGLGFQAPKIDATQAFEQGVVQPLTTNFNTNVLPGIAGQYGAGAGGAFGSDSLAARQQAGLNLDQTLSQVGSQYSLAANQANQNAAISSAGVNLQALGLAPSTVGLPVGSLTPNINALTSLLGAGAVPQQTQAAQDTASYNAFLNQFTQALQLEQLMGGVGTASTQGMNTVVQPGSSGIIPGLLGGLGQFAGSSAGSSLIASLFGGSDRRMKDDVRQIGEVDGLPVYTFRYKADAPNVTRVGFVAQDVEKRVPDAVREFGGMKHVNYGAVARALAEAA